MYNLPFLALAQIFTNRDSAPTQCIFGPWALFVVLYILTASKPTNPMCSDLLRIGLSVTALAGLYPHPLCYACSLHSLLACMQDLATDTASICAYSLFAACAVPILAQSCNYFISVEVQLVAIVWTEGMRLVHFMTWRLI